MDQLDQLSEKKTLLEAVERGEISNQRQLSLAVGLSLARPIIYLKSSLGVV